MKMYNSKLKIIGVATMLVASLVGTQVESTQAVAQSSGELVIYSGRREPLLTPVLNLFTEQMGISVSVKFGETAELAEEIVQLQGVNQTVPDVFIGDDAGTLEFVQQRDNAFVEYSSEATEMIPASYRSDDGFWMGVSGRARVLIYNRDLISADELPASAFDLVDPKWNGMLATTDGNDTDGFVPWISALRLTVGEEMTAEYLQGLLDNNIEIFTEQTDVRRAVGRGEFAVGLINNYYVYLQQNDPDPAIANVGIFYQDQGADQIGTLINATAAAIVRGSANEENAMQFMDFLASPEAQEIFAELNFEFPLLPGVSTQPEVLSDAQQATDCEAESVFDCIKQIDVPPGTLGREITATQELLQEVGWF